MAKRITKQDWDRAAEFVCDEFARRKDSKRRRALEREWKEIDRQLEMRPLVNHKRDVSGEAIPELDWLPEMELPNQAQTLETLTADARRMLFPATGSWFAAHALADDDYLDRVEISSLIAGDQNDVPSVINQDNVDQLVIGTQNHWHRQYDFRGVIDQINAEAFKYGVGVGRGRLAKKSIFKSHAQGVMRSDAVLPVLVPRSIKQTYLDDSPYAAMHEGHMIGPSTIFCRQMRLLDLEKAASKGSSEPDRPDGGWMPKAVRGLEADADGFIELIEFEGDMVIPRKTTESLFAPNVIVTVARGAGKTAVVRWRNNPYSQASYILFPYHCEDISTQYATSPLMKGSPIQKGAVDILNRMIMVAEIQAMPPTSYDADDATFAAKGGPTIYPGAQWATVGQVKVHEFGNLGALMNIYISLLQQYADVTGVNAPRLGAQTVSHTTAFAKEAELSRGTIRTVDYVHSTLRGALGQWLSMAWEIGRETVKNEDIYIDAYNGFATVSAKHLPEKVVFEALGAGGPAEEAAKDQRRMNALQLVLQIDQLRTQYQQAGIQPSLDYDRAIEQILRNAGWTDVDELLNTANQTTQPQSVTPPNLSPGAALQAIGLAGQ